MKLTQDHQDLLNTIQLRRNRVRNIILVLQYSKKLDGTLSRDAMREWGAHEISEHSSGLEFCISVGNIDRKVDILYCLIRDLYSVIVKDTFDEIIDLRCNLDEDDIIINLDEMVNDMAVAI